MELISFNSDISINNQLNRITLLYKVSPQNLKEKMSF